MMPRRIVAVWTCACLWSAWVVADESLFSPNSLSGWEHSAEPAAGWTMEGTTLRGSERSTPLLSGWTFGNFELRFRYAGEWQIAFPLAPQGQIITFQLPNTLTDNEGVNTAVIRREGNRMTYTINARSAGEVELPDKVRLGLSLAVTKGMGELSDLRVQEFATADDPAGTSLFNGKDLTGWWTPGQISAWGVKDGNLALVGDGGNYLRSDKEYANFTLSLEYKIRKRGNSGVGIRTARNGWPSSDGMEMQIEDSRKLDASATMAIYRNLEPLALAEKTEDWNHAVIKADGRMISGWLNGVLVQQVNTAHLPELRHRPLKGWIGFQDHGAPIEFRNIRVIEAPDGLGLDAWYAPRREPAVRVVLDRLMNPERLTLRDGSKSAVVSITAEDKGQHVLADLKGPGALVRITRSADAGKLAFYFDGESKPRIECAANQLHPHVPLICGDINPLLTFLGYEKSLKVVLRDAKPCDYHLDYVTLPPEMPVATFRHKTQSMPRGLLAAIDYRHFQISHGTYRDNDPLPRAASGNKTLPPGERVDLISLDGAGMIKWLRLHGDNKLLTHDDLWLEITVDGENRPALAAPARFFFPGLEEGQNYHNFLVLNKGGPQNVLPMPYGAGLKTAALNRGETTLQNVGVSVSYAPLAADQAANRLRLRGVYVAADAPSASQEQIAFTGRGRWIGLICQTPASSPDLRVQIDGASPQGWEQTTWKQLTGLSAGNAATRCLSGQTKSLAWCFHLLAPPEFRQSFQLQTVGDMHLGNRLALFYAE